jgi:hypothetical protein
MSKQKPEAFPDAIANAHHGVDIMPPVVAISPVFAREDTYSFYVVERRREVVRADWVKEYDTKIDRLEYGGACDCARAARMELIQLHRPKGAIAAADMPSFVNLVELLKELKA